MWSPTKADELVRPDLLEAMQEIISEEKLRAWSDLKGPELAVNAAITMEMYDLYTQSLMLDEQNQENDTPSTREMFGIMFYLGVTGHEAVTKMIELCNQYGALKGFGEK